MGKTHVPGKSGVFYGYWIVLAGFFMFFLHTGCGFYAFPLFVTSLQGDFGWGRGEIMLGLTISLLVMAAASPFVGRLLKRYEASKIIAAGAFGVVLSFVLLSQVHSLWHFYIGWALFGFAATASAQVPATAIVSNWFEKRRGTALGIMGIGVGSGGFVLAPIIGGYLIPHFGWRTAFSVLAVLNLALIPLVLLVVKTKPADMGLYPDGIKPAEAIAKAEASPSVPGGLSLKMALATSAFWLIVVCFLLTQFSSCGVIQSQVPDLEDIGFPATVTATTISIVGLGSAAGKFFFGWLCDRIPAKYVCCIGISCQVTAILTLMNIGPASPLAIIWLYAIVLGLGAGHWLPTMSMLTSTNFGLASYSTIFGVISFVQLASNGTGPMVAGYAFDAMGTYHWIFIIFASLYAIAIPAILAVKRPKSMEAPV